MAARALNLNTGTWCTIDEQAIDISGMKVGETRRNNYGSVTLTLEGGISVYQLRSLARDLDLIFGPEPSDARLQVVDVKR